MVVSFVTSMVNNSCSKSGDPMTTAMASVEDRRQLAQYSTCSYSMPSVAEMSVVEVNYFEGPLPPHPEKSCHSARQLHPTCHLLYRLSSKRILIFCFVVAFFPPCQIITFFETCLFLGISPGTSTDSYSNAQSGGDSGIGSSNVQTDSFNVRIDEDRIHLCSRVAVGRAFGDRDPQWRILHHWT